MLAKRAVFEGFCEYTRQESNCLRIHLEKPALWEQGGAESGALPSTTLNIAPELTALIDAWPHLPEPIKAAILALVRAAGA